jgi:hypothetical protein
MHPRHVLAVLAAASLAGCALMREVGLTENQPNPEVLREGGTADQPSHVVVQHVLISFDGANVPGVMRTKEQAAALAQRVLAEARAGHDFADLVRLYSDDRAGDGTYSMANWGVPTESGEVERRKMVRGFGALAFTLPVGQVGIVEYDANTSPFGWHVMKRAR